MLPPIPLGNGLKTTQGILFHLVEQIYAQSAVQKDQIALSICQKSSASAWWWVMWDAGIGGSAMVNAGITAVIKPFKKKMSGEHMNYLEDVAAIGGTIGAVNGTIGFVRRQHHDVHRVQSWHRSRETGD